MTTNRGFTLIELLMVIAIVAILLSVAVALFRSTRVRGSEVAAIAALEAINQAQFAYMQTCGNQKYAPTFGSLGKPVRGTNAAYLSPDLAAGEQVVKSGYLFRMSGTAVTDGSVTCTGDTPVTGYQITADPTAPGVTGGRYFGTNTDRAIFSDVETFFENMPETGAPDHGRELEAVRTRSDAAAVSDPANTLTLSRIRGTKLWTNAARLAAAPTK